MNQETGNTRDTSAASMPPTSAEPADHQVEQTEVRKLVGLVAGRLVNYVMANGVVRPFLVVNAFEGEGTVNGLLFFDGINDAKIQVVHLAPEPSGALPVFAKLIASVVYDEDKKPGTWHWPTKQAVVASSVDPEALATQLMGLNESILQKQARELELRFTELLDQKLEAHLNAANELIDGFKQLLEDLSEDTAKRAAQSVATIERPTEFASLDEATKTCGKDEIVHVAEDGKITIVNPSEEAKAATAGSQASDASTQGTAETERKAPDAASSQTGS